MRVRVRGIYSTAITKLLLDAGVEVSHSSRKIRERFSLEESGEPPTVTVKDTDQKHGIVIVGEYEDGKRVFEIIKSEVEDCFCWVSKLPLHAIVKGRVVETESGRSIVDLGEYRGILEGELEVGTELLVDVARPFFPHEELAKLSKNLTVYGKYAALIKNVERKVIFSKHVTDRNLRADLIKLAGLANIEGWGVKWRSSATIGEFGEMLRDLQQTFEKAEEVVKRGEIAKVGDVLYEGEFFAILSFGKRGKRKLDEMRSLVVPTIENHHSLKSMNESEIVEFAEHTLSKNLCDRKISEAVVSYVSSLMKEQSQVFIEHVSLLTGSVKRLTPGRVVEVCNESFVMKRVFRSRGVFDGLEVRKDPGDYDLMEFSLDLPFVLHKYYGRDGTFKGVYVNINTPPEISRNCLRYIDMEVDVVAGEGGVRIIDEEELEKACELGVVSEDTKNYYLTLAERVERFLSKTDNLAGIKLEDLGGVAGNQGSTSP